MNIRKELPLTYEECRAKWDLVNRTNTIRPQSQRPSDGYNAGMNSAIKGFASVLQHELNKTGKRQGQAAAGSGGAKRNKTKHSFCQMFNTASGCSNVKSADGCVGGDGVPYRHGCSVRVPPGNRTCQSKDHSAPSHFDN